MGKGLPQPKELHPTLCQQGLGRTKLAPDSDNNDFIIFGQVLSSCLKRHTSFQKGLCVTMDQKDVDGACRFMRACGRPWSGGQQQDAYQFLVFVLQSLQVMHASLSSPQTFLRSASQHQASTPAVACTPCMAT